MSRGRQFKQRLPALQHIEYRRFLIGSFISNIGGMIQGTALALHVYAITDSSFMVGLLGLVRVVPLLVCSLFGGIVADHWDRRRVLLVCQVAMALLALFLTAMEFAGRTQLVAIYVTVALFAVARSFEGPARQSMVPNLVTPEHLPSAIGINGISWRLADVVGPILASVILGFGGLAGFGGYGTCYLVNAVSFLAVVIALSSMPPKPAIGATEDRPKSAREVFASIGTGLEFVRNTPILRNAMWIDFWATFFSAADALLPAMATKILGHDDAAVGIMQSAIGVGALFGALFMTWRPTVREQGKWVISMIGLYGLCTLLLGLSPNLPIALLFLAGTGFADMVSTVLRQTIRQTVTPDVMRGRMSATSVLFNVTGPQLGDFEAGTMAKFTGERAAIVFGGAMSMLVALHWGRRSPLKEYHHAVPKA